MSVTSHQHWYDQTTSNGYPVADQATFTDDDGKTLPAGIVIDLQMTYPRPAATRHCYFSAITCGPGIVTVAINLSDDLDDPGVLVATATLRRSTDRRLVKLESHLKGLAGWIVFGPVIAGNEVHSFRFSSPRQSLIVPRASKLYALSSVTSVKTAQAAQALEGIVKLTGQPPVAVRREIRRIDGYDRKCMIVSLLNNQGDEFTSVDTPPLQQYLGLCDIRPESGTCPDPQPIETVSQVSPNCNGRIILELRGCAQATKFTDSHGFVIDCAIPRQAVCPSPRIPSSDGTLPNEYSPATLTSTTTSSTTTTQPPDGTDPGTITLPFQECFRDGITDEFATIQGTFNFVDGDDPYDVGYCGAEVDENEVLQAVHTSVCLAAFIGSDMKTVDRSSLTHVRMEPSDLGGTYNGGLLLNYRLQSGTPRYFLVLVDYLRQAGVIYYFNGFTHLQVGIVPMIVKLDNWYSVRAYTVDYGNLGVGINCVFHDLEGIEATQYLNTAPLTYYRPSNGVNGIATRNSAAIFSHFRYTEGP